MKLIPLPPATELRALLAYESETGKLTWARNGGPALQTISANGYRRGRICGAEYLAHRVIWKMVMGEDPHVIDHINGNRMDNRLENLRAVSSSQNSRNARLKTSNSSGINGVHWDTRRNVWIAKIWRDGKRVQLVASPDLAVAAQARAAGEREFGYHPNHGRI